ncbi:MAG: hypothetical protein LBM59_04310 [Ruminococcus sp.]|jgi:hypothetical protein|nr:hypothetical protein [Ruminococcus sp.]
MSDDILKRLIKAKAAEEVVAIIDEAGGAIELEDAKNYLAYRNRRVLSDSDLELIAGGRDEHGSLFIVLPDGRYVFNSPHGALL